MSLILASPLCCIIWKLIHCFTHGITQCIAEHLKSVYYRSEIGGVPGYTRIKSFVRYSPAAKSSFCADKLHGLYPLVCLHNEFIFPGNAAIRCCQVIYRVLCSLNWHVPDIPGVERNLPAPFTRSLYGREGCCLSFPPILAWSLKTQHFWILCYHHRIVSPNYWHYHSS